MPHPGGVYSRLTPSLLAQDMEDALIAQEALARVIEDNATTIAETPATSWSPGLVTSRLGLLDRYWQDFQANHVSLMQFALTADDPYLANRTYSRIESAFVTTQGRLFDAGNQLTSGSNPSISGSMGSNTALPSQGRGSARLPRIEVPEFNCQRDKWESFRDMFRSLIHDDQSLSDVEKLFYLKSHVKGEARSVLDSFQVTSTNYATAWQALELRYDNSRLLVQDHIRALKNLRPLKEESAAGLQRLQDDLRRHRDQLRALDRPVDGWDDWLISCAVDAMDPKTRRAWEHALESHVETAENRRCHPSYEQLAEFLERQCRTAHALEHPQTKRLTTGPSRISEARQVRVYATTSSSDANCAVCSNAHQVSRCPVFKQYPLRERKSRVRQAKLCYNCLGRSHVVASCPSNSTCRDCGGLHHTLLHDAAFKRPGQSMQSGHGERHQKRIRALIDPCSEATLISATLARQYGFGGSKKILNIAGAAGILTAAQVFHTTICLRPLDGSSTIRLNAFGLQRLEITTPSVFFDRSIADSFGDLSLADPHFNTPSDIDLVIGADAYSRILLTGIRHNNGLVAQQTVFGWTITGRAASLVADRTIVNCSITTAPSEEPWHEVLIGLLRRFWAVEEVPTIVRQSLEDIHCEVIYTGHTRDATGRYHVPLPARKNCLQLLGDSLDMAGRALSYAHRRMDRDHCLREEYTSFMREYESLGHMRRLTEQEVLTQAGRVNYLPHYGIWQRKDGGRKLRVVFNASSPTTSGTSLNDALLPGPKLQSELATVITRWRRWPVAFCADIKMMFRQIRVLADDEHLQRILWSPSEKSPPIHFALLTVTYGVTCAPYLALRTLQQLCKDEGKGLPEAVSAVEHELYVDDFLCGSSTVEGARRRRDQLIELLRRGGFTLKKWVSNAPQLLEDLPPDDRLRPNWMQFATEGPVNELGIAWDPYEDAIHFIPPPAVDYSRFTKRHVLSSIARLFDPSGWLSPIVVTAKFFMQDLWKDKLDWDEPLPLPLARRWQSFESCLRDVGTITLPRWLGWTEQCRVQLHSFADASRRAIAAAVYIRVENDAGLIRAQLITAKTKLTSIKSQLNQDRPRARMTIPRLELRAALLAAKLLHLTMRSLNTPETDCFSWTDSQTTLHWLNSQGPVGNDFVDNYVSHVHEVLPHCSWSYVRSTENPADLATRGTDPLSLSQRSLWWHGPRWLAEPITSWTASGSASPRPIAVLATRVITTDFVQNFSKLVSLLKALCRCRRLFLRRRDTTVAAPLAPITALELRHAFLVCARSSQRSHYALEIQDLKQGKAVCNSSKLRTLAPFLDDADTLRVGGRLNYSGLLFEEQHPVILDGHDPIARLIIDWAHVRALHGGYCITHYYALKYAWLVGGKSRIKAYLRGCVVCAKTLARPEHQKMASLPSARVTVAPPFHRCGVDYAGPFQVLHSKGRSIRAFKGYVAVFVCFSTKAIHFELAGDLTTASLFEAIATFIGHRGKPCEIWSDNATNFKGAEMELRRLFLDAQLSWGHITNSLAADGISWKFIPPAAPH